MSGFARRLATAAAVVLVAGVVVATADRFREQVDLTAERSLTLSTETRRVLGAVDDRVRITAFLARADPARVSVSSLLSRFRRENPRISYRVLDPADAPAEAARLGIDPVFGGVAVRRADDVEVAPVPSEQDITAAVARVLRPGSPLLCYATGHGQPDVDATVSDGWASAAELLGANGYRLEEANLLAGEEMGESCDALVLVNPTARLEAGETAIVEYLAAGGDALVLTDPASTVDLEAILGPYGLGIDRGIVFEGDPNHRFPDDPARPIVLEYRTPSPIARRLPPTFFPGVQRVTVEDDPGAGLAVVGVATTTDQSYLEKRPLEPAFDPGEDVRGPIVIAAAADKSEARSPGDGGVVRTRVVVVGDADFSTNSFIGEAGNGALLVRSLDWLTLDQDLVSVSPNIALTRPLDLSEGRLAYARFLTVGVVPALFLIGGAFVWLFRRAR